MRIVEPNTTRKNKPVKKSSTKKKRRLPAVGLAAVAAVASFVVYSVFIKQTEQPTVVESSQTTTPASQEQTAEVVTEKPADQKVLRQFTDNEFKVFYDRLLQKNLERVENPPAITGNDIADARIRSIAERRGYRLRSSPSVALSSVDGLPVQTEVVASWQALKEAALDAGIPLSLVSGFRSEADQRELFTSRLAAAGGSAEAVAAGTADQLVDFVLVTTSIPGYSKHHTGYTLDFACAGYVFENFKNSPCNSWLAEDNYKVAKLNGFIPSYPPLADAQGPDPEAWEYVWVGTELLYE